MQQRRIGVLALQGDVLEHVRATQEALIKLKMRGVVIEVRDEETIKNLDGIIIPGGESTVLHKLTERANIFEKIKNIKNIFGTCAGTIFLAKNIENATKEQRTLELVDMTVDRNAYGAQIASFEENLETKLGEIHAVFIRAPRIKRISSAINILAKLDEEIVAGQLRQNEKFYLFSCFHPELTTTLFHEYFLKNSFKN